MHRLAHNLKTFEGTLEYRDGFRGRQLLVCCHHNDSNILFLYNVAHQSVHIDYYWASVSLPILTDIAAINQLLPSTTVFTARLMP